MAPSISREKLASLTENNADRILPIIRSFERKDQSACQNIFKDGYQEFIKSITVTYLSLLVRYIVMAAVSNTCSSDLVGMDLCCVCGDGMHGFGIHRHIFTVDRLALY